MEPDPNAMQQDEGNGVDEDEAEEEDEGADHADPSVLKSRWDKEAAFVRLLEREGMAEGHPTMRAAAAARDAAEQAYKGKREPHPVARRMGWAQSRLDKAFRLQSRTRRELAAFDEGVKLKRDRILAKLEEDMARVSKHRQALEELQEEAGAELFSTRRGGGAGRNACGRAAGELRHAAPRAAALVESLPEGSPAWNEANLLVAKLSSLQAQLEQAAGDDASPEAYDIGDDDEGYWSESHDLDAIDLPPQPLQPTPTAPPHAPQWQAEGFGRWHKGKGARGAGLKGGGKGALVHNATAAMHQHQAAAAAAASTATAAQVSPNAQPTTPTPGGGTATPLATTATPPRAAPLGGVAQPVTLVVIRELAPSGSAEGGLAADGQANKQRRGQREEDTADAVAAVHSTRKAVELIHQQAMVAAAGFETAGAAQLAGQMHAQRVAAVVERALAQNVQPLTDDGEELIMLGPEDLRTWACLHLADEEPYW